MLLPLLVVLVLVDRLVVPRADALSSPSVPPTTSPRFGSRRDDDRHHPPPLNSQQRRQESLQVGHHPLLSLNLNLDALARAQAPERAQELYQRISALWKEGYYAVAPDVVSFNSVLKAWQSDPERALQFWEQEVQALHDEDAELQESGRPSQRDRPLEPNVRSYNTFLVALARAGMCRPAELLLRQMQHPQSLVRPDRITYNTVLLALCCSNPDDVDDESGLTAPERASALLQELVHSEYLKPDVVSFNTVLTTWSNVGTAPAAQRAEELLERMPHHGIVPDVHSYSTVIQGWARCGNSHQALTLLRRMTQAQPPLEPNKVTYTAVLQALCRNKRPQDAHDLLQHLIQRGLSIDGPPASPTLRPDAIMFSALMKGWADWIRPSTTTPQQAKEAVQAVLELLRQMKDLSGRRIDPLPGSSPLWPDIAPNEQTYTSVLSTLARSRHYLSGPQCESILRDMVQSGLEPTTVHWNAVLDAYAKSPRPNKLQEARRVWSKLVAAQVTPDTVTYNTMLATAANSFGKDKASHKECLDFALEIFRALQEDPHSDVNSLSFHYLVKALRKFMPRGVERDQLMQRTFDSCCDHGCLSDSILHQLLSQMGWSEKDKARFFGEYWQMNLSIAGLPSSWSRMTLKLPHRHSSVRK